MKKATNSALMRMKNEKLILSMIYKVPISRVEIAKKTGLTKAAVTFIVDDLMSRGILLETDGQSESVGRTPKMLSLNGNAFYVLGINITRHHVAVGITNLVGEIVSSDYFSLSECSKTLAKIKNSVEEQMKTAKVPKEKIYKGAVVTPGPVNIENGMILNPPNFNEWHHFPIVSELTQLLGVPFVFENVSSATALSEKLFGAAIGTENFLALRVDEGIGSGIVLDDVLFRGPCELGHISISYDGKPCECGNRGCLEKYAAISAILNGTPYQSWQEAVDADDETLMKKEAEFLSCGIVSANNIFSFDKIVLCGDLSYRADKLVSFVSDAVRNKMLTGKYPIVSAGIVSSRHKIAAAVAIYDFIN